MWTIAILKANMRVKAQKAVTICFFNINRKKQVITTNPTDKYHGVTRNRFMLLELITQMKCRHST